METVTAVFAHPDDETFICGGTLAQLSALGHEVHLVCATRGEMGRRMGVPPTATRESLPVLRERELQEACEHLGVRQLVFLGYRDKSLEIQPMDELVDKVSRELHRLQPKLVITFHPLLGGHPDHCTIGDATTEAFQVYQQACPEAALFYVAWKGMADHPESYGLERSQLKRVNVSSASEAKLEAYRAHRTQSQLNEWLWKGRKESAKSISHEEFFIRAVGSTRAEAVFFPQA